MCVIREGAGLRRSNFRSLNRKSFVFRASILKPSLLICRFDGGGDLQTEALHHDCLMVCGAADTAHSDRDAGARGQHEIHA